MIRTQRCVSSPHGLLREEVVFHVTTHPCEADVAAELIQSHWSIENAWHGLRDVGFHEDASEARTRTARGRAWCLSAALTYARLRKTEPNKTQREIWRDPRELWKWWKNE